MKIAAVYTSTTPELTKMLNDGLNAQFEGQAVQILSYQDPSILQEARDNGGVTPGCAKRLVGLYNQATADGADIILNVCSSVGAVAKLAKPLFELMGYGFIRIDEDMAMEAVKQATRIGVIATLPTTLNPTKQLIQDCADRLGKNVELIDGLAEGAYGLNQTQFKEKLIETGSKLKGQVDALLFAQGSMAYAEKDVSEALCIPVFSSIRFGTAAVKRAADAR